MRYLKIIILVTFLVGCGGNSSNSSIQTPQSVDAGGSGKGGSMARFVISGDYLYALNKRDLTLFDISKPSEPLPETKVSVPFDVETLFSYGDYLYVGAEGGVYIYTKPINDKGFERVATFTHTKSCDPVVVQNDLAFITLRSGSSCRLSSVENSLQILDVKNPLQPKLIYTKNLIEPKGLGIDNDKLFICDGAGGLKTFNVVKMQNSETNETTVSINLDRNSTKAEIDCYDLIPDNGNLVVSNGDDVRQFDYTKLPMIELGKIK